MTTTCTMMWPDDFWPNQMWPSAMWPTVCVTIIPPDSGCIVILDDINLLTQFSENTDCITRSEFPTSLVASTNFPGADLLSETILTNIDLISNITYIDSDFC